MGQSRRLRPLWGPAVVAAVAIVPTAYIAMNNPHVPGATYQCPLFAATGLLCPGCGGTRAVYDLTQGDVVGAVGMNPLLVLAVPLVALVWIRWLLRAFGMQLREWPFPTWAGIALPAVIVVFAVLRNVPRFAPYLGP